jgi:hypothetical protein
VLNATVCLAMLPCANLLVLALLAGFTVILVDPVLVPLLWIGVAVTATRQLSLVSKTFDLATLSRTRHILMECGGSLIGTSVGLGLCWLAGFGGAGILWGMLAGAAAVVVFDL